MLQRRPGRKKNMQGGQGSTGSGETARAERLWSQRGLNSDSFTRFDLNVKKQPEFSNPNIGTILNPLFSRAVPLRVGYSSCLGLTIHISRKAITASVANPAHYPTSGTYTNHRISHIIRHP